MCLCFIHYRNSIPPTTTLKNLKTKATAATGNVYVDVGFWGGVIPGNQVGKVYRAFHSEEVSSYDSVSNSDDAVFRPSKGLMA